MNDTSITITGNLTRDPELRFTPSGKAVAGFSVASTPRRREGDQWVDGTPTFWDCEVWGQAAENIAESLAKGVRVLVTGVIRTEVYTPTGSDTERRHLKVVVDEVGPSLKFVTATVNRSERRTELHPVPDGEPAF